MGAALSLRTLLNVIAVAMVPAAGEIGERDAQAPLRTVGICSLSPLRTESCVAAVPQWFGSEVLQYLPSAIPGAKHGQYYARCPVPGHADRRRSFAIAPGDSIPVVFWCHGGCSDEEVRDALIGLGISEDFLGPYGTPEYEVRRKIRSNAAERAMIKDLEQQVERLRWEMLELKASVTGLMNTDLKMGLLKIRIQAVIEGIPVPTGNEADYVTFAERAGVPKPSGYRLWRTDPLVKSGGQTVVIPDHVVLAQPEDESQASQVTVDAGIIKMIEPGGSDSRNDNDSAPNDYQNDNAKLEVALETLRTAGMTKPAA